MMSSSFWSEWCVWTLFWCSEMVSFPLQDFSVSSHKHCRDFYVLSYFGPFTHFSLFFFDERLFCHYSEHCIALCFCFGYNAASSPQVYVSGTLFNAMLLNSLRISSLHPVVILFSLKFQFSLNSLSYHKFFEWRKILIWHLKVLEIWNLNWFPSRIFKCIRVLFKPPANAQSYFQILFQCRKTYVLTTCGKWNMNWESKFNEKRNAIHTMT